MASAPIISWQIVGEAMKTVTDLILGAWKKSLQMVTAAMKLKDTCSWKKIYDQLSILISRDITLPTNICLVRALVFSSSQVWMWELDSKESWVPGIDTFEPWCWRRLSQVPWTARRSNQSILKAISSEYTVEGLRLKLKLQYFGHPMRRTDSVKRSRCRERLKAGRERDDSGWDD